MRKILFLTLFLLLGANVFAIESVQDNMDIAIIPDFDQPAKVNLTITDANPGIYNIYTLTAVKILPSDRFSLTSGTNILPVEIYPTTDLYAMGPAAYSFIYNIRNVNTKQSVEKTMTVRVLRVEDALVIGSDTNSPDTEKITFYVRNRENIALSDVKAHFSSIFFDFEENFDIAGNSKKEFSVSIDKDKLKKIEAGSYLVKAVLQTDRGERTLEGRIILGEKKGVEAKDSVDGFLIVTNEVSRINYGNVVEEISIQLEKDIFSRLFTSFNIQPDVVSRDGFQVTYAWEKKLLPADSFQLKAKTNYLLPLLILIAIVFIIVTIRRYTQTKIEVVKSVVPVKTKTGHFALKIKLSVRARKTVQNVSLIDRIPGIVQIYEKFASPTQQPTKIDSKNRRIQWDIGDMNAGEERMYSYMVYSTVGVVGKFALPPALAVFEKLGQIHEVDSNSVYFLAEQRAMDE